MINVDEFLKPYKEHLFNLRENLKKDVQQLINEGKISYEQAINIFEDSKLFEIKSFIICEGIFDVYTDDISGYINRCETIYFSQVIDWINDSEGEVLEAYNAISDKDPYKEIYDTVIDDNIVGFKYDW